MVGSARELKRGMTGGLRAGRGATLRATGAVGASKSWPTHLTPELLKSPCFIHSRVQLPFLPACLTTEGDMEETLTVLTVLTVCLFVCSVCLAYLSDSTALLPASS